MKSACADCADRGVGATPWSAPGTAPSLSFNTSNALQGVCGAAWTADLDYNSPSPFDVFGVEAARTYAPGEVFDVEWCVSADHGGVPQFRLCADEALVSALTTPGYTPSLEDHEALEACFQDGLLRRDPGGLFRRRRGAAADRPAATPRGSDEDRSTAPPPLRRGSFHGDAEAPTRIVPRRRRGADAGRAVRDTTAVAQAATPSASTSATRRAVKSLRARNIRRGRRAPTPASTRTA